MTSIYIYTYRTSSNLYTTDSVSLASLARQLKYVSSMSDSRFSLISYLAICNFACQRCFLLCSLLCWKTKFKSLNNVITISRIGHTKLKLTRRTISLVIPSSHESAILIVVVVTCRLHLRNSSEKPFRNFGSTSDKPFCN